MDFGQSSIIEESSQNANLSQEFKKIEKEKN
jgi:hypothetical protein